MEYQHIGMAGEGFPKGFVRIVRVDVPHDANNRIEHSSIFGFTARIGESYILHIPVPKELPIENSTYEGNWDPERFDHYLLAFLKPTDAGIELRLLNSDFLIDEIKSGRLEGKHAPAAKPNDGETVSAPELTVTASSEALRAFFEQHFEGDLLLEPRTTYRRIE